MVFEGPDAVLERDIVVIFNSFKLPGPRAGIYRGLDRPYIFPRRAKQSFEAK